MALTFLFDVVVLVVFSSKKKMRWALSVSRTTRAIYKPYKTCLCMVVMASIGYFDTLKCRKISRDLTAILNDVIWSTWIIQNHRQPQELRENKCRFIVNTVPADDLAPPGARASAGTVMTIFESRISTETTLERLITKYKIATGFLV